MKRFRVSFKNNPTLKVEFESDNIEKAEKSALRRMSKAGYMPEGKPNYNYGTIGWVNRNGMLERSVVYGSSRSDSYGGIKSIELVLKEI